MRKDSTEVFEYSMIVLSFEYNDERAGWDYKLKEDPSNILYGPVVKESNLKRPS
jgi:hypothetical protein